MRSVTSAPGYLLREGEEDRGPTTTISRNLPAVPLFLSLIPLPASPSLSSFFHTVHFLFHHSASSSSPLILSRTGYLRPLALYISYPLTLRVTCACPPLSYAPFVLSPLLTSRLYFLRFVRLLFALPLSPTSKKRPVLIPASLSFFISIYLSLARLLVLSSRVPTLIDYGKHHELDIYGGETRDARGTQSRI